MSVQYRIIQNIIFWMQHKCIIVYPPRPPPVPLGICSRVRITAGLKDPRQRSNICYGRSMEEMSEEENNGDVVIIHLNINQLRKQMGWKHSWAKLNWKFSQLKHKKQIFLKFILVKMYSVDFFFLELLSQLKQIALVIFEN